MYTHGDHVKIAFPAGHENAQLNGLTGKVVSPADEERPVSMVFLDSVWGSLGIADEHLQAA